MRATKAVLIIGGSGFIGSQLALFLRERYRVYATYGTHPVNFPGVTFLPMLVENRNWIKRTIYSIKPDAIVYVAGNNNREWTDRNLRKAEAMHSVGAATLATSSDIIQPKYIYLSNSYVFDGVKGNYHEGDTVLPATMLGKMKLSGENIVKGKSLNYLILRSSPVFGIGCGANLSYVDRLRMCLERKIRFEASPYEIHSFAPVEGLCDLFRRVIESGVKNKVVHYGGLTKMTYYEFAVTFAERFGYDKRLIVAKGTMFKKAGFADDHVFDFSLNSTNAVDTLKVKPLLLEQSFDLIEKKLVPASRTL